MSQSRRARPRPKRPDPVTIAYVHSDICEYSWTESMLQLLAYDYTSHGRLLRGGRVSVRFGTDGLVEARNLAVTEFLKDDNQAPWFFWVDTDMGFQPDALERLMEAADADHRPVLGGLCFACREDKPDGFSGWRTTTVPTLYQWVHVEEEGKEKQGFSVRWDYPVNTVLQVDGTGSAFLLIHRRVFEAVQAAYGTWYTRVPNTSTGQLIGEDLSFCLRVRALGIPVHVHTGVEATHAKRRWLQQLDYFDERALAGFAPPPLAKAESA